ncbi:DNA-directed RNA polymerase subunit N [Candidatus Geothermarchaeota archaeon]|nr:MAG: DNA-directed RNA polymerase subunit N [Candidatus Geothermarchaeota archaeon]HEW93360.1 DNA-directed RNA polymerase subunit N [Thermoprotei archaeon]
MITPVRCFTCGSVIGDKYEKFIKLVEEGMDPKEALDKLGVKRYCCRRMLLTHVEIIDEFLIYRGLKYGKD